MIYAILGLIAAWVLYKIGKSPHIASGFSPESSVMNAVKAREVLGVKEDASKAEAQEAYHALIKKLHPDAGGSAYLTNLVIEAKKVLERE